MKTTNLRTQAWLLFSVGIIAAWCPALAACSSLLSPRSEFLVRVDSISAPASVGPTDTIVARFFGMVGSDRCSWLESVESQADSSGLEIRFHGERIERNCGQMPVFLDHEERIPPPFVDPYVIRVVQPAGPPLEVLVRIE